MKTYIINLSSIINFDIEKAFDVFVDLLREYSFRTCPATCFFTPWTDRIWLNYTFNNNKALIDDYTEGLITTKQFLKKLLIIFDFHKDFFPSEEDKEMISKNRNNFYSTEHLPWIKRRDIALALLEKAWRAMLVWNEESRNKLITIFRQATRENAEIIFMTNTNPLHVDHFLQKVRKDLANEADFFSADEVNVHATFYAEDSGQRSIIAIAENPIISIAPAYRFGLLKTGDPINKQSILSKLCKLHERREIVVVSQNEEDLREAECLGLICQETDVFLAQCYREDEEAFCL